jgi:glycosyltransferase involved in cell wall biosynthesis
MRVGINAYELGSQHGGDETYLRNLIRSLVVVDPRGDYSLLLGEPLADAALPGATHMRRLVIHPKNPLVRIPPWRTSGPALVEARVPIGMASLALVRERIDVVHALLAAPMLFGARLVLTLHDITFERYPQFFTPDVATKLRIRVPLTVRRAAAIFTISEYSKRDIVRRYCVPSEKVTVTPLAADPMYRPMRDEERDTGRLAEIRAKYGTGERFILSVGNLQPRKNLRTLIEAYVKLRQADATRHKLVLVGREAWLHDDIFAAARASGYADELVFTGYVPDADLVALYNAADVFVYPSLFEGFGLPPLEAMACGTPTVTGNTSALPETVGEAALMVDPRDAEALAGALARVLGDAELRAELAGRGIARAAAFSWERTARIILDTYRRAAQPERW